MPRPPRHQTRLKNSSTARFPTRLAKGKFNLNVRLRYEQVNEEGAPGITKNSFAPTIRTRFGYTTAPLYGFQGMLEGVNVSVLGPEHNYNAAGSNGQGARPVVADPPLTGSTRRGWVTATTNIVTAKVGQQRIDPRQPAFHRRRRLAAEHADL